MGVTKIQNDFFQDVTEIQNNAKKDYQKVTKEALLKFTKLVAITISISLLAGLLLFAFNATSLLFISVIIASLVVISIEGLVLHICTEVKKHSIKTWETDKISLTQATKEFYTNENKLLEDLKETYNQVEVASWKGYLHPLNYTITQDDISQYMNEVNSNFEMCNQASELSHLISKNMSSNPFYYSKNLEDQKKVKELIEKMNSAHKDTEAKITQYIISKKLIVN